jgi:hypothetical protein
MMIYSVLVRLSDVFWDVLMGKLKQLKLFLVILFPLVIVMVT